MMYVAILLFGLWVLGLAAGYTLGGSLHILLVIALVMTLLNFTCRDKPV